VDADLLWLLAGVGLLVGEVLTLTAVLGLLGLAALLTGGVALLGAPVVLQAVVFAGSSAALLAGARRPVQRMLAKGDDDGGRRTDARMLTGSRATVLEAVTEDSGQVRLNGELWRARPYAGNGPFDVGRSVSVAAVEGATLLVYSPDLT
jgi:membrane protein implicated in regulation of membrane protease activity